MPPRARRRRRIVEHQRPFPCGGVGGPYTRGVDAGRTVFDFYPRRWVFVSLAVVALAAAGAGFALAGALADDGATVAPRLLALATFVGAVVVVALGVVSLAVGLSSRPLVIVDEAGGVIQSIAFPWRPSAIDVRSVTAVVAGRRSTVVETYGDARRVYHWGLTRGGSFPHVAAAAWGITPVDAGERYLG